MGMQSPVLPLLYICPPAYLFLCPSLRCAALCPPSLCHSVSVCLCHSVSLCLCHSFSLCLSDGNPARPEFIHLVLFWQHDRARLGDYILRSSSDSPVKTHSATNTGQPQVSAGSWAQCGVMRRRRTSACLVRGGRQVNVGLVRGGVR